MLLCYALQQVEQSRDLGEDFAMQHAGTEYLGALEDELQTVLDTICVEKGGGRRTFAGVVAGRGASAFLAPGSPSAIHARGACGRAER